MNPKQQIIALLRQADAVVSGEVLSAALGISRVAVWKHIKGLVQSGTPIISSAKGYFLHGDPDSLYPWVFGSRQTRIHFFQQTSSTMDEAAALVKHDCPNFTVVIAQRQSKGRGRMQRHWLSADGGLYFTIVIRLEIPIVQVGLVNLAAAIDMADTLQSEFQIDARLKWPNDILVKQRKICGILSQMAAEGEHVSHINIGIGLNVNNAPEEEPLAVSMRELLGRPLPRRDLLMAFLDRFETRMSDFDPQLIIEQWKSCNVTLGQRVRVFVLDNFVEGTAVDIDAHGGLILEMADGAMKTVMVGDCFHR